jgi:hypothetical protein
VFPIFAFGIDDVNGQHLAIDLICFVIWGITILFPLYLARAHRRKQHPLLFTPFPFRSLFRLRFLSHVAAAVYSIVRCLVKQYELARQLGGVENLADLLLIPEGAAAFGLFCSQEFTYDSFSFYMRAIEFKKKHSMMLTSSPAIQPTNARQATAKRVSVVGSSGNDSPVHGSSQIGVTIEKEKKDQQSPIAAALRAAFSIHELFIVAGR